MSRSFAGRLFTRRPPIRISPPDGASRPAIIRSNVDFPQPEGPTKMRNSRSAIDRSMSRNTDTPLYAL